MGLCEITPSVTSPRQIIAYPGIKIGSIHFVVISNNVILYLQSCVQK